MHDLITITRLAHSEQDQGAWLLAHAFIDDPLFVHFFPDQATRAKHIHSTFSFVVSHALEHGKVYTTLPEIIAISIWLPSQNIHRSVADMIKHGGIKMLISQTPAMLLRQIKATNHMQAIHRALVSEPHHYLSTIGIQSAQRGQGIASQMLKPTLAQADQDQKQCYLDTHNPRNVPLYEHLGFRVVHESLMPDSRVRHWAMLREPQTRPEFGSRSKQ